MITLNDNFDVLEDGSHIGALADTIKNRPELVSEIQKAIAPKLDEIRTAHTDALAVKDAVISEKDTTIAELTKAITQARTVILDPEVADKAAVLALKSQIELLDTPANDKRRAEIDAQIAKLQAEKGKL